jgi:hypothetical protein
MKLKYSLLNIILQPSRSDRLIIQVHKRQLLYSRKNLFQLYIENKQSKVKAKNLYAVLYSKYYTQRFILQQQHEEEEEKVEDDFRIQQKMKEIFEDQSITNENEMENRYLDIIRKLKRPEIYLKYEKIKDDEEENLFYIGSTNTDALMETKLRMDLQLFETKREKVVRFLRDYGFLNQWISSICGVVVISGLLVVWTY